MQPLAELLRWLLIALQCALLVYMAASGLWRRLPLWCLWMAAEALSRVPFTPHGNYWHLVWVPMQPALMLLLIAAAAEAWWQGDHE